MLASVPDPSLPSGVRATVFALVAATVGCGTAATGTTASTQANDASPTPIDANDANDATAPSTDANDAAAPPTDASDAATTASPAGMGAVVNAGGVAFRVWAPDATSVWVRGDFNGWATPGTGMSSDGNGNFSVAVDGAGAGQQYEYVIQTGSTTVHRADPRSRQVLESSGTFTNSVIVDPSAYQWQSNFTPPPFDRQVIYELHIGTFDGSAGMGTWHAAAAKLGYLAALGVNMIEVLPIAEFVGDYSWGYDPSFPFAPESAYGLPDDAKSFIDHAHALGMGVIVDVVHNHYGPELGRSLWCFDVDCFGAGGIYFYTDWREETGFGPRPDFGRQAVRDYIVDNAEQWLQEYRADGLRWDSTVNIRMAKNSSGQMVNIDNGWPLLQRATDTCHGQPGKIQIAEDLQGDSAITSPTSGGGAGFDSQWAPEFFYPMKSALTAVDDSQRDMNAVAGAIDHSYGGGATTRVIFTENHDQVAPQNGGERLSQAICPGLTDGCKYYAEKRTTLGAAVLMTSPGIPMLFQGQEFVEDTPFPFDQAQGIDWTKESTFSGIVQLYADLIHMRLNAGKTTGGLSGDGLNAFHVNNGAKVVAYHRWSQGGPGDDVVVVANFSNVAFPSYIIGFPRVGAWHVRFNSDWSGYSPDFGDAPSNDVTAAAPGQDGLGYQGSVGIGPYTAIVLSQ
jgi:1,4-alpha-glucan branching enzyme